ncbi:MAG: ABC transporter ATP-binding protein, partial [Phycisphaeraceae bacterium]
MSQISANTRTITVKPRDDREVAQRPLNFGLIMRMMSYTRDIKAKRTALLFCVLLRGIQVPMVALILSAVIKGPITDRNFSGIVWGACGFFAFVLFTYVTLHFRQRLALELGEHV